MANELNMITPVPQFSFISLADQVNVTGDGTNYKILFPDALLNSGNHFSAVTSTFTAPIAGKYMFGITLYLSGLLASMTDAYCYILAGAIQYKLRQQDYAVAERVGIIHCFSGSVLCPLAASDTAEVHIVISGGTKVVTVKGYTTVSARVPLFYGFLLTQL